MSSGKLIVLSAPSGTGKTTICKKLLINNPKWKFSVSATTRDLREGEKEVESNNSNEEKELDYRLKNAGFQLWLLPSLQVRHNRKNLIGGFSEIKRRYSNNYYRKARA